jgi:hypothetical protein
VKRSSKIGQTLHLFAQQTFTGEERRLGTNLPQQWLALSNDQSNLFERSQLLHELGSADINML